MKLKFIFELLLICAIGIVSSVLPVKAVGTYISAPNRVDMVYDEIRDVVYITNGSDVLRYQVTTGTFLQPISLGGRLGGIDLSPDGQTLAVADFTKEEISNWIYLIDLSAQNPTFTKVNFTRRSGEGGTYTVAYGNDGSILVTSTFDGSGWVPLRRYFPNTDTTFTVASVRQNSMLTPSGDASIIGIEESSISSGPFGRFRVSDGNFLMKTGYVDGTSWFNYEIGVNRNGTHYSIPTYGGTFTADENLQKSPIILGTYAGPQPIGVVYHPVEDLIYYPWTTTSEIRVYDSTTLTQVGSYDFQNVFVHNGNHAFTQGRLKISRDGSLLMCSVNEGVRIHRIYTPLTANSQTIALDQNTSQAIVLSGTIGNNRHLEYTLLTPPKHGVVSGTLPDLEYVPDPGYVGSDEFKFEVHYGRSKATGTVNLNILPVNLPPVASNQTVVVNEDNRQEFQFQSSDPEGLPVTITIISGPANGTLSSFNNSGINQAYTPDNNFFGSDQIVYQASDGVTTSQVAVVTFNVIAVNDPPQARNDTATTKRNQSILVAVLRNDDDIEGDQLTVTSVVSGKNGSVVITQNQIKYTPRPGFIGRDQFTYTISDGKGGNSTANVVMTVVR